MKKGKILLGILKAKKAALAKTRRRERVMATSAK